jgi:hypothetical protein
MAVTRSVSWGQSEHVEQHPAVTRVLGRRRDCAHGTGAMLRVDVEPEHMINDFVRSGHVGCHLFIAAHPIAQQAETHRNTAGDLHICCAATVLAVRNLLGADISRLRLYFAVS